MAANALAVVEHHAPAVIEDYDDRRVKLIRETFANDAPELDFQLFLAVCRRTGLSPEAKQIYFIGRYDSQAGKKRWTVQASIDGYRLIADRSRCYAGSDDPLFAESGQMTRDGVKRRPDRATVTVWKLVQGVRCPFTASARWDEYCPGEKQDRMWRQMPCLMLGKVAESLALRKAFPAELSGVYTDVEMDQAEPGEVIDAETGEIIRAAPPRSAQPSTPAPPPTAITQTDLRRLHGIGKDRTLTHDDLHALAFSWFKRRSVKDLTVPELNGLCGNLDRGSDLAITDEQLAAELHTAYGLIEETKAAAAEAKAEAEQDTAEPAPPPAPEGTAGAFTTWHDFWTFVQLNTLPTPKDRLEAWLGETITHLTPQQAKELVVLRISERAQLDAKE